MKSEYSQIVYMKELNMAFHILKRVLKKAILSMK